jgi:hypothetical protein
MLANQVLPIARDAVRTLWAHKRLWVLGFFVAAGAGGGVQIELPAGGLAALPGWVLGLSIGAGLLGVAILGLHVVSEGALVEAVRDERRGRTPTLERSWKRGLRAAGRVLGLEVLAGLAITGVVGLAAAPLVLGVLEAVPLALGAVATALLAVVALPVALSVYLAHEAGIRLAVLEQRGPLDALRGGLRFLRGRLRFALTLFVVDGVAQIVTGLLALPFALVALGAGFGVHAAAGIVPAVVVGVALAAPVGALAAGARGTFRSALWTHALLDERPAIA